MNACYLFVNYNSALTLNSYKKKKKIKCFVLWYVIKISCEKKEKSQVIRKFFQPTNNHESFMNFLRENIVRKIGIGIEGKKDKLIV